MPGVADELVAVFTVRDGAIYVEGPRDVEQQRIKPWCCEPGCPQDAAFAITDTRPEVPYDDAEWHACADHVRKLGGEEPGAVVTRLE